MFRGVELIDGSLMVEPYELRWVAPDLRHRGLPIGARRQRLGCRSVLAFWLVAYCLANRAFGH
jgi:hypothetical protein